MGEEVPLGADIRDWQSGHLTEAEKGLLTQIFRFFTQSDVEVGDNYLKRYIPIFQPLEVQMMMAAFTNMETVHIDAYALLLKTLGMPQTEFEAFRDYAEMKAKADYMHTFGVGHLRRRGAHPGHVRRLHRRHVAVRQLRHADELPALQQDERHGPDRLLVGARRKPALRRHHQALSRLERRDRLRHQVGARRHPSMWPTPWSSWKRALSTWPSAWARSQGMTAAEIKSYVRYIADWRLTQLKLTPVFGNFEETESGYKQLKPHPLPWLVEILNGVEHANFFEQRATEYSKGATTRLLGWRPGRVGEFRQAQPDRG